MTTPDAREPFRKNTPRNPKRVAEATSGQPVRQPRAPAWKCPRCGTRKRLRGDRRG